MNGKNWIGEEVILEETSEMKRGGTRMFNGWRQQSVWGCPVPAPLALSVLPDSVCGSKRRLAPISTNHGIIKTCAVLWGSAWRLTLQPEIAVAPQLPRAMR